MFFTNIPANELLIDKKINHSYTKKWTIHTRIHMINKLFIWDICIRERFFINRTWDIYTRKWVIQKFNIHMQGNEHIHICRHELCIQGFFFVIRFNELSKELFIEGTKLHINTSCPYREKSDLYKEMTYSNIQTKRTTYSYEFSWKGIIHSCKDMSYSYTRSWVIHIYKEIKYSQGYS